VNPNKPFVLRVDASTYAVGATLEQLLQEDRMPTPADVRAKATVPVAFLSQKLTSSQRNWAPRELETHAIVLALQKWESWIGLQPILVLTDHKALESWTKELLDTPSGPIGRRLRWQQLFSKFDLSVGYIPGKENEICDILSRWAYPACQAFRETSKHGTEQERAEMEEIMRQEKIEESTCLWIRLRDPPMETNHWIRGVERKATQGSPDGEGETSDTPPREYPFRHPRRYPQPMEPKGKMHHEAVGGEGNFSPKVGIEHHLPTTEVEEEQDEAAQLSDMESEMGNTENEGLANPPDPNHSTPPEHSSVPTISSDDELKMQTDPTRLEENWGHFIKFAHAGNIF